MLQSNSDWEKEVVRRKQVQVQKWHGYKVDRRNCKDGRWRGGVRSEGLFALDGYVRKAVGTGGSTCIEDSAFTEEVDALRSANVKTFFIGRATREVENAKVVLVGISTVAVIYWERMHS